LDEKTQIGGGEKLGKEGIMIGILIGKKSNRLTGELRSSLWKKGQLHQKRKGGEGDERGCWLIFARGGGGGGGLLSEKGIPSSI